MTFSAGQFPISNTVAPSINGKVYLVGAGPGDPGLMTLKGKSLLEHADVVIYDALVSPEILTMIGPQSRRINVGKRRGRHSQSQEAITQLMIEQAHHHAIIVRLKGGDPYVFGRGAEEAQALLQAGIAVEIIPGITAGIAATAYAGIPVTHRELSSAVTFVTGHEAAGKYRPHVNWSAIAQSSSTIVVYMGIHNLSHIVEQLQMGGLPCHTPIALVRWGTREEQSELFGTLDTIVEQVETKRFSAPAIAIIGTVVDLHESLDLARPSYCSGKLVAEK